MGGRRGGGLTRCPGRELQRLKGRQAAAGQAGILGVGQEELAEPGLGLLGLGGAEGGGRRIRAASAEGGGSEEGWSRS